MTQGADWGGESGTRGEGAESGQSVPDDRFRVPNPDTLLGPDLPAQINGDGQQMSPCPK